MPLTAARIVVFAVAATIAGSEATAAEAAFPGANGRIGYTARTPAAGPAAAQLITANPDGSDERVIASGERLSWSADGTKIAYDGNGIAYINADGSGLPVGTGGGNYPAWSPDGTRIAAMFLTTLDFDIGIVSLPSLDSVRIAQNSGFDGQPAWSPDGSRIAFTSVRPGQVRSDIYTVDPAGVTEPVNLTNDPATDQYPSWSPDGRQLAFSSTRGGNTDVYVMDSDGSGQTRLTTDPAEDFAPAWSPDGRKILFLAARHGDAAHPNHEVYVMDADGSAETRITFSARDELDVDWQPIPNRPPDCSSVTASPYVLEPANHKLTAVRLQGGSDADGDTVTIRVGGVTQDEPVTAAGDPTAPDAAPGPAPDRVLLRAERNPRGDGRVYRVRFTASDGRGGSCEGAAAVSVPRHRGVATVDSAPPSFDSFGA